MDANIEPFKMADGKLTAVKVEHHGTVEIIEIDPTPFQDYLAVVSLVKEYLQARMEHALARSKFEDARDLFAATTDKFENVQRKMKFLRMSTAQGAQGYQPTRQPTEAVEPTKTPSPANILILSEKESFEETADRHRKEMEESLKQQEPQQEPQPAPAERPRRIVIGEDVDGLIKKEGVITKHPLMEQPSTAQAVAGTPKLTIPEPEPVRQIVAEPTSAESWAKKIYGDVLLELKRRTGGRFEDTDLIIEVTRKGVPAGLVMDTVEILINTMEEKKLFQKDEKKKFLGIFGGKKE